jgi:hypothetical protein
MCDKKKRKMKIFSILKVDDEYTLNSSPAIMPLAALYFGVIFKGAYLPQKWDLLPPF